jgi:hypothetical protein
MFQEISFWDIKHSIKYIELISAIVGSIYFFKYKYTFLKYFLFMLWLIVFVEFFAIYYVQKTGHNQILYNLYHSINFPFLFILYRTYIKNEKQRKAIGVFIPIYLVFFFGNIFFQNYFTQIQTIPFIIGALFTIISILFYFLEILNTDKVLKVSENLLFWISIGLLLYFVGKIPLRIVKNYWKEISNYQSYYIVEYILSIIMNICFIIGFIWSRKDKQY